MSLARVVPLLLPLALFGCGGGHSSKPTTTAQPTAATPTPSSGPSATQAVVIPAGRGPLAAMALLRGLTVRDRPNGKVIAHLNPTSAWDSPTVVWSVTRRGPWLGGGGA